MPLSPAQIAEAFSRHAFDEALPYLADSVRWNLVGGNVLEGKENVTSACRQSARYLAGVQTTFRKFRVIVDTGSVVVESLADYTDAQQQVSTVASCDLYDFADGQLTAIISYTVQVPA